MTTINSFNKLTSREHEIMNWAVQGLTNKEIAFKLTISKRTVDAHFRNIRNKCGLERKVIVILMYRTCYMSDYRPPD